MVYSEARLLDNQTIVGSLVKVNWLGTGSKLSSIIDAQAASGTFSLTVKVYRIDPGAKGKLGASTPVLSHAGIQAAGLNDQYAIEPTTGSAPFTGLFRTEYAFSGPGNITLTHTLVAKD
jgi:hypothetical protein